MSTRLQEIENDSAILSERLTSECLLSPLEPVRYLTRLKCVKERVTRSTQFAGQF